MVIVEHINAFLNFMVLSNSIRDYMQALAVFLGLLLSLSVGKRVLLKYLGRIAERTTNDFDDFLVSLLSRIGPPVFYVAALYFASLPLSLSETVRVFVRYALVIVLSVRCVVLLQHIMEYSVAKLYRRRFKTHDGSAEQMVKSVAGVLRWMIWLLGGIFVLDNLGINISALVAGIGIGGVAVALAAQAVLGDAFSALSIFLDKPFEVGDFIILDGDYLGTVEHIGIKTTRIRSLFGEQLVLSNSDLTKSRIKNYKRMQTRRIDFTFGISRQTPLDKVRAVPQLVKDIFAGARDVKLDRAHLKSLGDSSLIYEVVYFVNSADYNTYMDRQQQINLALMEKFEQEGIEFAYPTQTLNLKTDRVLNNSLFL